MSARSRYAALAAVGLLALTGCADGVGARGDDEPITARAVAVVALDHLPADDTTSRRATYVDESDPPGYVGADLRFGGGAGDDGQLVATTVTPDQAPPSCEELLEYSSGCDVLPGGVVLWWRTETPEEDQGAVSVAIQRDGATVVAYTSGPPITGDPRGLPDLEPSVETLERIVTDDRLAPLVPPATNAAGRALDDWDGGEREPGALDRVEQTSAGLVGTFFNGQGGRWTYVGPTPDLEQLGAGAVGGRTRGFVSGPIGPGVLDVVAVPQLPAWAEPATCREGWRCWTRGDTRVVWRPARGDDPGESWLFQPSGQGGVAGLHVAEGRRIPDDERRIKLYSGYVMFARLLTDPIEPQAIGLTTTRESLEQAEARSAEHEAG